MIKHYNAAIDILKLMSVFSIYQNNNSIIFTSKLEGIFHFSKTMK